MTATGTRALYVALMLAAGCAGAPTQSITDGPTALSFAGRSELPPSVAEASRGSADTIRAGFDVLVITRARIALRPLALGTSRLVDCSSVQSSETCRALPGESVVVDLPLGGSAEQRIALDIPAGAYAQLALEVAPAAALGGMSVRVEGTYNGAPFIYETNLHVGRGLGLPRPLVIGLTGVLTNVTVRVPVSTWFRGNDGALINPAGLLRDSSRERALQASIAESLRAFEDRDRDGDDRNG